MVSGFNAMQAQLGLLPVQGGAQPLGVTLPPPPPPPPVMTPGEASSMANQQMQASIQQTQQAAQMTRYTPPPSSPAMGGGGMPVSGGGMGYSPHIAQALGGGGAAGGGMPHPMMMTAPQYGGYRPMGAASQPYLNPGYTPSPINPMAVTPPPSAFSMPYQQDYRRMQGDQSAMGAYVDSKLMGGLGIAGALGGGGAGAMIGRRFGGGVGGMLGAAAGSFLGATVLPGIGEFLTGSAISDMQKGRQIQNMTAPYMVGGESLNPFTGQGMEREAARNTARGIRRMTRDHVFERETGFNTADVRKITQLASDQGLMETAQNPEDIIRKVKTISKSVKALISVTGDPDVKAAIAGLGQMKNLGFEGLEAQTGAVATRAHFARMAGVSQAAMGQQYGMPGAMMGQQMGLAGATGYSAGMMGGAQANMAIGAGAFTDLQKARAGGRQGIAQTNMMAYLGSINQRQYMAAALTRDDKGELTVDTEAYKRAQGMDFREVTRMAQANISKIGREGIEELNSREQELKDELAQKMGPLGMQMNWRRQIEGLQKVTKQTRGAAIYSHLKGTERGQQMSETELKGAARTLELEFDNTDIMDTQIQQLEIQRRHAIDRERKRRSSRRTPGLLTRMGESMRDMTGGISDSVTGYFTDNVFEPMERAQEDRAAFKRGEHIRRSRHTSLIRTPGEAKRVHAMLLDKDFQASFSQQGADPFGMDTGVQRLREEPGDELRAIQGALGRGGMGIMGGAFGAAEALGGGGGGGLISSRMQNRAANFFGVGSYNEPNKVSVIASQGKGTAFGAHPFASFGDTREDLARIKDVQQVGRAAVRGESMTEEKAVAGSRVLREKAAALDLKGFNVTSVMAEATSNLAQAVKGNQQGQGEWYHFGQRSATALADSQVKQSFVAAMVAQGHSPDAADKMYSPEVAATLVRTMDVSGQKGQEVIDLSRETDTMMGALSGERSRDQVKKDARALLSDAGLGGIDEQKAYDRLSGGGSGTYMFGDKTLGRLSDVMLEEDTDMVAMAAAIVANNGSDKGAKQFKDTVADIERAAMEKLKDPEKVADYMAKLRVKAENYVKNKVEPDEGVKAAFMRIGEEGGWGKRNMLESVEKVKTSLTMEKATDVQANFIAQLSSKAGFQKSVADAPTAWDAMKRVNLGEMEDQESDTYKLAKRIQEDTGDDAAVTQGLRDELALVQLSEAPASVNRIFGGRGGKEVETITRNLEDVRAMRDKVKKKVADKEDVSKNDLAVMQAESSVAIASAAKNLNEVSDKWGIILNDYRHQGRR